MTDLFKNTNMAAELEASDTKVCIPVVSEDQEESLTIADRFNRASKYLIVDLEKKESSALPIEEIIFLFGANNGNNFRRMGISAIIGDGISFMAHKILNDNDVRVFKPQGNSLEDNLNLFAKNKLEVTLDGEPTSSCVSQCGSCSSDCNSDSESNPYY
jgi:predicted Fe-Mo cluster-binding NifX family protein